MDVWSAAGFVCSQCWLKATGQILESGKPPAGLVSLPCVFIPKQDEEQVEVGDYSPSGITLVFV